MFQGGEYWQNEAGDGASNFGSLQVQKGCFPILHLVCSRPAVDAPNAHLPEGLRQRNITESEVSATPVTEIPPITMSSPVFDQQTMMFQMYQNYLYMMGMK